MRRSMILVVTLALVALVSQAALAQEPGQQQLTPEQQAMMAKWMEFASPGEPHKLLAQRVGSWTMKVTSWESPDAEPFASEGTAEVKSVLDGRYVEESATGTFGGMPFSGRGFSGYDNLKKKYVSTWIDNMGTGIMMAEGDYDAAKKTFTYSGEMPDPMTGKYKKSKSIETWAGPDTYKVEMHCESPDGKGMFKNMELVYTRKK